VENLKHGTDRQTDREKLMEMEKNLDIFASINKRMFIEYNY
jgi:predicted glycosyl hydrolase (DUF1957 family)